MSNNVLQFTPKKEKIVTQIYTCNGCNEDYFHIALDSRVICAKCLKNVKGFQVTKSAEEKENA